MSLDPREIFLALFDEAKEYIPESDHIEMCNRLLVVLSEQGFNVSDLHGEDEVIDEVLEEMLEEYDDYNEEDF